MTGTDLTSFSQTRFLADYKKLADILGAPYSESTIKETLITFAESFKDECVIWRTTNRPNDVLNYRFYARRRLDTIAIAIAAGHLEPENSLARLATSWSALFDGDTNQWCDFHPVSGLVKTWVNLRGTRSVDDVLNTPEVPDAVRAHRTIFHGLGLDRVRFVAVDYEGESMNIYFTAPGPLSESQAVQYIGLAQPEPPTEEELRDMSKFLNPKTFFFAVTLDYATGAFKRVAFYANILGEEWPVVNDRIKLFFDRVVSYDEQHTKIVGWSFGAGNKKYMKAESSYVGDFAGVLKDGSSPLVTSV